MCVLLLHSRLSPDEECLAYVNWTAGVGLLGVGLWTYTQGPWEEGHVEVAGWLPLAWLRVRLLELQKPGYGR